jgi:leader peptidase (prepilin peptidase)/N-methyltransferase
MMPYYIYIWIFIFGLVIGSFLNVLIYRIPRKIEIGMSRSFCPSCKKPIKFYDNIPLLSYLILRGRCRYCRRPISFRYPLVELLNGGAYVFYFWHYGISGQFLIYSFVTSVLLAIFFIDLDYQIIPDALTIPGIIVGLGTSFMAGGIGIISSAIGLVVGGGALYLVALLGDWLFKKESMGGGDIKMAAMLGAFLGWQKVIIVFMGGAVIGLVMASIMMIFSKKLRSTRMIPFGPFLAVAAIIAIIYGEQIISFYWHQFLAV